MAFVDNARGITAGQDLTGFPTPTPTATNTNGLIQLLDSSFSIPSGTTPVYARQLVEWQTTTQFPAGTTVATGYELYTNNAGTVTRHSFATDGSLTSSDELSATARQVAEMQVGIDLTTGTGNPSISVNNRILGTPPLTHDQRALYQSNAGLLVSLRTDLETYATPFSTPTTPGANTEQQATLLLDQSGNTAFAIRAVITTASKPLLARDGNQQDFECHNEYDNRRLRPLHPRCQQRRSEVLLLGRRRPNNNQPRHAHRYRPNQAEALTRSDLSGNGSIGTSVTEQLTNGITPTQTIDSGKRSLFNGADGLFVGYQVTLPMGPAAFNNIGVNTFTDEPPALFLTDTSGNAFNIDKRQARSSYPAHSLCIC